MGESLHHSMSSGVNSERWEKTGEAMRPARFERRFQNYRGTWAWLVQRISAICLFLLIPIKIYTGWVAKSKVPEIPLLTRKLHFNATIDILLLLFFLLHGFYGLRVILIDVGAIREDKFFWRTLVVAMAIFVFLVWFVYI